MLVSVPMVLALIAMARAMKLGPRAMLGLAKVGGQGLEGGQLPQHGRRARLLLAACRWHRYWCS
jgi:hypothetical protein